MTERELTIKLIFSIKVSVVEDLHGDLFLVVVLGFEVRVVGGDELLDVNRGDGDLLVFPFAVDAHGNPISNGKGGTEDNDKEDVCLEPAMGNDGQDTFQHPRDAEDDSSQMEVVEITITLSDADEGWVFYGRGLGYLHGRVDHGRRTWRKAAGGKPTKG